MSTICCLILIGTTLANNGPAHRYVQIGENEIRWKFDDLSEDGELQFRIRTPHNQFSFGWNKDESFGGDLVFVNLVDTDGETSVMDSSEIFVHGTTADDGTTELKMGSLQSAWTLIDIKFEVDNTKGRFSNSFLIG